MKNNIHISLDIIQTDDKVTVDVNSTTDEFGSLSAIAYAIDSIIHEHHLDRSITIETLASLIQDLGDYHKIIFDAKEYHELKTIPKSDIDEPIDDTYDQSWINQG